MSPPDTAGKNGKNGGNCVKMEYQSSSDHDISQDVRSYEKTLLFTASNASSPPAGVKEDNKSMSQEVTNTQF